MQLRDCFLTQRRVASRMTDLPPVKPSAIALGTFFNHGVELAVLGPVFGQTYQRAKAANTKEEFVRSKEASGAAIAWGTSFVGSALQSYGVGALINATGTLTYRGAAYLGGLIFAATAAPSVRPFLLRFPLHFRPEHLVCATSTWRWNCSTDECS